MKNGGLVSKKPYRATLSLYLIFSRLPKPEKPEEIPQDVIIDVGVIRYANKESKPKAVEAKPEQEDVAQKLIPTISDAEMAEVRSLSKGLREGAPV